LEIQKERGHQSFSLGKYVSYRSWRGATRGKNMKKGAIKEYENVRAGGKSGKYDEGGACLCE